MTLLPVRKPLRGVRRRMGMTEVRVRVVSLTDASHFADVDMVVDSDAIYSVVPACEPQPESLDPLKRRLHPLRLMIA
jgi:hypothetical protein